MPANPYRLALWRAWKASGLGQKSIIAGRADSVQLKDIPPDVEMDDATITFWNGEKFEDIANWPPYTLIEPCTPRIDPASIRVTALCGTTTVELRRDGSRWLMWVGTPPRRRKDFATPFVEHAQRTAVFWYGEARSGWTVLDRPPRKPPQRATQMEPEPEL
jgi:hypothetical protein